MALAARLPHDQRQAALSLAQTAVKGITNEYQRVFALCALAAHLQADQRRTLLDEAATAASAVKDPYNQAAALARLAPELPLNQRHDALTQALAAAIVVECPGIPALTDLAPHLPADLLNRALTFVTSTVDNQYERATAIAGLAPYLPVELLPSALDAAITMDGHHWAKTIGALAPRLAGKPDLISQALDAAIANSQEHYDDKALEGLAPHLPPELLGRALTAVLDSDRGRGLRLAALVPHLPPDLQESVFEEALSAAIAVIPPFSMNRGEDRWLRLLAPRLTPMLTAHALTIVSAMKSDQQRALALSVLARFSPADCVAQVAAAQLATTFRDRFIFMSSLGADGFITGNVVADAWLALAPRLPAETLDEAIGALQGKTAHGMREAFAAVLNRADEVLTSPTQLVGFLRLGLSSRSRPDCLTLLTDAQAVVERCGDDTTIAECVAAIHVIHQWWT